MITVKGNGRKIAKISDNSGSTSLYHVTFWINEEQMSVSKRSKMFKTLAGAKRAALAWVAQ